MYSFMVCNPVELQTYRSKPLKFKNNFCTVLWWGFFGVFWGVFCLVGFCLVVFVFWFFGWVGWACWFFIYSEYF